MIIFCGFFAFTAMADVDDSKKQLKSLKSEINVLDKQIKTTQSDLKNERESLQTIEESISKLQADKQALILQKDLVKAEQVAIDKDIVIESDNLKAQKKAIGAMILSAYKSDLSDKSRLVLNQQNPTQLDQMISYYGYISMARQEKMLIQKQQLAAYIDLKEQAADKQRVFDSLDQQLKAKQSTLKTQQDERLKIIATLDSSLSNQANRREGLKLDEKNLEKLIKQLQVKGLERQRKERELAEKQRIKEQKAQKQRALAQEKEKKKTENDRKNQAQSSRPNNEPAKNKATVASVNSKSYGKNGLGQFQGGQLNLPVKGQIVAKFGSPKSGSGIQWNGILLNASMGAPIHAIYDGEVIYADWFRGFGQMVIIDHGNGYMSLYSHNRSILAREGEKIKRNQVIASVGNSGGLNQSGLYFEIRYNGEPVNPLNWCR